MHVLLRFYGAQFLRSNRPHELRSPDASLGAQDGGQRLRKIVLCRVVAGFDEFGATGTDTSILRYQLLIHLFEGFAKERPPAPKIH